MKSICSVLHVFITTPWTLLDLPIFACHPPATVHLPSDSNSKRENVCCQYRSGVSSHVVSGVDSSTAQPGPPLGIEEIDWSCSACACLHPLLGRCGQKITAAGNRLTLGLRQVVNGYRLQVVACSAARFASVLLGILKAQKQNGTGDRVKPALPWNGLPFRLI